MALVRSPSVSPGFSEGQWLQPSHMPINVPGLKDGARGKKGKEGKEGKEGPTDASPCISILNRPVGASRPSRHFRAAFPPRRRNWSRTCLHKLRRSSNELGKVSVWVCPRRQGADVWHDSTRLLYYLRIENAEGYVLIAVYLFMYLFICMRVPRITQTVLNRIAWNLVGWLVIIRGPFD